AWHLLLIVPLLVLVTPLFNFNRPRLFGVPFFYWFQFAFVIVWVASTACVYLAMRREPNTAVPDKSALAGPDVDDLDAGNSR
ncbi:MAG: DUF3311 domain-containing protein, partial [Mycobacteriales bacterium]